MKVLIAQSGPQEGNAYPIDGHIVMIGRDGDCDVQLIDSAVSRRHACVVEQDNGSVLLRDLVSHNGTYLRGQKVVEALLAPGDEIGIGSSRFLYRDDVDELATHSHTFDLKLISGPALAPTLSTPMSAADREEILALARMRRAEKSAAGCCGSPLAAQGRKDGWKFCPACGADLTK
jgi:pSer/pThr/pTyr-binding forkhead associated (FHA) protein